MGYLKNISYKSKDGKMHEAFIAGKDSRIVIASVTSSEKAKAVADFVIPNNETIFNKMQEAFNSIPSTGGEIHLCAGIYDFDSLADNTFLELYLTVPYNNMTISGEGKSTIFNYNEGNSEIRFIYANSQSNLCVRDILFKVGYGAEGVLLKNCNNSLINNCSFVHTNSDAYNAISLNGGTSNIISGNHITTDEMNSCINLYGNVADTMIVNNVFQHGYYGDSTMISLGQASDTMIQGNSFCLKDGDTALSIAGSSGVSKNARGCFIENYISLEGSAFESRGTLGDIKIDNVVVKV